MYIYIYIHTHKHTLLHMHMRVFQSHKRHSKTDSGAGIVKHVHACSYKCVVIDLALPSSMVSDTLYIKHTHTHMYV
jgi:hypothetical protein